MNAKIKAEELVSYFKVLVNGYVGSSMLTNTEYPESILVKAKICALKVVHELRCEITNFDNTDSYAQSRLDFWDDVINEINSLEVDLSE